MLVYGMKDTVFHRGALPVLAWSVFRDRVVPLLGSQQKRPLTFTHEFRRDAIAKKPINGGVMPCAKCDDIGVHTQCSLLDTVNRTPVRDDRGDSHCLPGRQFVD